MVDDPASGAAGVPRRCPRSATWRTRRYPAPTPGNCSSTCTPPHTGVRPRSSCGCTAGAGSSATSTTRSTTRSRSGTDAGYTVVSVNYRLTDPTAARPVRYPTHNEDVAAAVAWVHATSPTTAAIPTASPCSGTPPARRSRPAVATDGTYLGAHGLGLDALRCAGALDTEGYDVGALARTGNPIYRAAFGDDPRRGPRPRRSSTSPRAPGSRGSWSSSAARRPAAERPPPSCAGCATRASPSPWSTPARSATPRSTSRSGGRATTWSRHPSSVPRRMLRRHPVGLPAERNGAARVGARPRRHAKGRDGNHRHRRARARAARDRRDPRALDGRGAAREFGSPGHADGTGTARPRAVHPHHEVRRRRARLARPRPVRPVERPRVDAALLAPLPHRLRPHPRRPARLPPVGLEDRRPPRVHPRARHRGHDRAARPGLRQRGRDRAGRGEPPRPLRRGGRRPPHLRVLRRRRPRGGREPRGGVDRRAPRVRAPHVRLRRQPHHHRRSHRALLQRQRARALRGVRVARRPAR